MSCPVRLTVNWPELAGPFPRPFGLLATMLTMGMSSSIDG